MRKVDVCVNIYGKPYQTIATLKSLLNTNGEYIDNIYIIEESKQPEVFDFEFLKKSINYDKLIYFKPKFHLWINQTDMNRVLVDDDYRLSVRYQYALEDTDKKYLLIIHNDVLFQDKFLDKYIEYIDNGFSGIAEIGQCWNCPLSIEGLCYGEIVNDMKLNNQEIIDIINKHKHTRTYSVLNSLDKQKMMPLPECRLNEWVVMLNANTYREYVIQKKEVTPIGAYLLMDLGVEFYKDMLSKGFKFKNILRNQYYQHAYFSNTGNGHSSLSNINNYKIEEEKAKQYLIKNKIIHE